ncbi:hypothetical protein [Enterococcus hirae]|uniref:hypothetical protein n=1 Tax=Enterococcus hirae TaxID=1354 RepID=UPI0037525325
MTIGEQLGQLTEAHRVGISTVSKETTQAMFTKESYWSMVKKLVKAAASKMASSVIM